MTIDEIKELIQVLQETGIAELEVQRGDSRVKITRMKPAPQEVVMPTMVPVSMTAPAITQAQVGAVGFAHQIATNLDLHSHPANQVPETDETASDVAVKSPIVGTYYDAPSPGAPAFVKLGDRVEPKQVLCIIESMKLMNEIEAEVAGTLIAKLVENGRPVEYGEALFTIRPLS